VEITTGSDKIVTGRKGESKWKIHQVMEKLIAGLLTGINQG